MSLRINVDSDDVVYNLSGELLGRANERWGLELESFPMWGFGAAYGATTDDVRDFFERESRLGLYFFGKPVEGAVGALHYLAEQGHDLRIVTHKHGMGGSKGEAMADMIEWYEKHDLLDIVDIVFAQGDKTQYPADVVIDDKPTLAWAQPTRLNLLFDQPWNQKVTPPGDVWTDVLRVKGWDEVLKTIELEQEFKG